MNTELTQPKNSKQWLKLDLFLSLLIIALIFMSK